MSMTLEPGVLRLSTSSLDARPLFWNEGATRLGYEPEAAQAVADALGLSLVWNYTEWGARMDSVVHGEADGVWCGVSITPDRLEVLDFTHPYAYFNETCILRQGLAAHNPAELAGLRIGAAEASTNLALVEGWEGVEAVSFNGDVDDIFTVLIDATVAGDIDGFVDDEPAVIPLAARDARLQLGFSIESRHPWACGVRKGNADLVAALNEGIAVALDSGALEAQWKDHLPFLPFPLKGVG